jgi:hypothetical protein
MAIHVPSFVLGFLAFVVVTAAISFGVAFAVNEWRKSGYIDCITRVEKAYLDQAQPWRGERPVSPKPPQPSASRAAWDTYYQQSAQYLTEYDSWIHRGDVMEQQWFDQMRACD